MFNSPNYIAEILSITLDTLQTKHKMSARTYNVCLFCKLTSLGSILNYYHKNTTFKKLSKMNPITNKELLNICSVYMFDMRMVAYFSTKLKESISPISGQLTEKHIEIMDVFVMKRFAKLSIRTMNVLNEYFNNTINFRTIEAAFFEDKSKITEMEGAGKKTSQEVLYFVNAIQVYAFSVAEVDEATANLNYFIDKLSQVFNLPHFYLEAYIPQLQNRQLPLFAVVEHLLLDYKIIDVRMTTILKGRHGYFINQEARTLDDLGKELEITRERVRQLSISLDKHLNKRLELLNVLKEKIGYFTAYPMDWVSENAYNDCIYITQHQADTINQQENCSFTPKFIHYIFNGLHQDTYKLLTNKHKHPHRLYSIRHTLTEQFDFDALLKINTKTLEKNLQEDIVDYDSFLRPFLKKGIHEISPRIKKVATTLIRREFTEGSIFIDTDDNVVFPKKETKAKHGYDYIVEVLEEYGEPMTLKDIMEVVNKQYPNHFRSVEQLRAITVKEKAYIWGLGGRSGYYALPKWKKEGLDIKSGNMKKLIVEYLTLCDTPQYITEIRDYILKYRPNTNLRSMGTLLRDAKPEVILFSNCFWGLTHKAYSQTQFNPLPTRLNWHIEKAIEASPTKTEAELVQLIEHTYGLQTIQVISKIEQNIQEGRWKRENDKLMVV